METKQQEKSIIKIKHLKFYYFLLQKKNFHAVKMGSHFTQFFITFLVFLYIATCCEQLSIWLNIIPKQLFKWLQHVLRCAGTRIYFNNFLLLDT